MKDKGLLEPRGILSLHLCFFLLLRQADGAFYLQLQSHAHIYAHEFKAGWDSFIIGVQIDLEVSATVTCSTVEVNS